MEDVASLWTYQESLDELKQKLLCNTLEMESVKMEANEGMRKNKEYVKQLVQLLKIACQERDEARDQLQKLLNKLMPCTAPTEIFAPLPQFGPESPLIKPTKAHSSISESNSLSDTYNHHSHGSSPVNSFLDAVSSPELSNMNVADSINLGFVNQPFVQDYTGISPKIDEGCLVVDNIVKGKSLPKKGKFLQAVLEAGPLLQTLLVAGPLPQWRNPPPLQTFHIPPVAIKGSDAEIVPKLLNSSSFVEISCGSSQMFSATSMLNFSSGGGCAYAPSGKRQRLQ
ncbi:uncharacterized protein LOC130769648 isoform X2 [Actinidia eriantha]|uniref:uncharacterized protein LOC130769648 isoform X2 n=1 Tax=Actinidia eriantha TaxID=165200 RepID=UPI00258BBA9D|nr:uncharacterized protein LOC130769648 isoform X2 [Actinidia eriantha]